MFRFDNYLEQWAANYLPISHNPAKGSKDKGFVRMDTIARLEEMVNLLTTFRKNIVLGAVTQVDLVAAPNNSKMMIHNRTAFVIVKQATSDNNELAAADAKHIGLEVASDLIACIKKDRDTNPIFKGFSIDGFHVSSSNVKFGSWWPVMILLQQVESRQLCVNPEKYNPEPIKLIEP